MQIAQTMPLFQNFDVSRIPAIQKQQTDNKICPRCRMRRKIFKNVTVYNAVIGENVTYSLCNYCADYVMKHKDDYKKGVTYNE